jgi:hypothetical protein
MAWRHPGAKCELAYIEGDPNPWCRCTTTIPAAADTVFQEIWSLDCEAMRYHAHVEYRILDRPSTHSVDWSIRVHIVPVLPAFEWRLSGTWAQSVVGGQKEYSIVFLPALQRQANPASTESHTASTRQLIALKPGASPNTTKLTYIFQLDFGSHSTALERVLPGIKVEAVRRHRASVASIKKYFGKQVQAWLNDVESDTTWRGALVDEMRHGAELYTGDEVALLAQGAAQLDAFADGKGRARSFKRSKTVMVAETKFDKRSGILVGHVGLVVQGSPEEIVAFLMHFDSKFNLALLNPKLDVRYETLEVKNCHHIVVLCEMKTAPFLNRTWLNALLWRKVSDSPLTYLWVAVPIDRHDKLREEDEAHAIRAKGIRSFRLTRISDGETRLEYSCSLDLMGHFPRWLTNNLATPQLMLLPYKVQTYFAHIKQPSRCTAADGVLLGHLLVDAATGAKRTHERAEAITMFVRRTAVLRECEFASLDEMIIAIFAHANQQQLAKGLGFGRFMTVLAQSVATTNPSALTAEEAATIGQGFKAILRISATPSEAVDDTLLKYPALGILEQRHAWFRPMLETIAKRQTASSPLGLKLRLAIGALISIADMVSDIVQLISLYLAGQNTLACALLGLILANLAFQLLVVFLQTSHRGWRIVAWEVSWVVSLLKPGLDAVRVGGGEEHVPGAPLGPLSEMVVSKVGEVLFEALPNLLLLAVFLLKGGEVTTVAVVSIVLSCFSTSFTMSMLAFDLDTSTNNRNKNPEFFGYVPDSSAGRVWTFILLFVYHSAQTIGKVFATAMLARASWLWLVAYVFIDHSSFQLYKVARNDQIYWIPGLGIPISILARFGNKAIADFTGSVPRCSYQPLRLSLNRATW